MLHHDLHSPVHYKPGFAPVVVTDNTAQVSAIIDLQNFNGCEFIIQTGTLADADATFAVLVEEGDDSGLSDAAAAPDTDLLGTEAGAAFNFGDDNAVRKIGYVGGKRYVRLTCTPSGNAGSAPLACLVALVPKNRSGDLTDGGQDGI